MGYHHFPCSIARFWKRGFETLGHTVKSAGFCSGGQISWGPYNLDKWTDKPDYLLAGFQNVYPVDIGIGTWMADCDLFINVDAACFFRGSAPIPKVIIGTDGHCLDYAAQRQDCDMFVGMHRYYSQPEDFWLGYAYDERWHFHQEVPIDHDVTFYGVFYPERNTDLQALHDAGLRVKAGTGLVFDECVPHYSSGHIAYCRPSLLDLPARFFEAMAYGNIPLTTKVPDLALFPEFKEGWHYEVFEPTRESLIQAARRVLQDPKLEQRKQDCLEAVRPHSWRNRAAQLLKECERRGLI